MKKGVILFLIFIMAAIPFASAQITFDSFLSVYNLGDFLTVEPVLLEDSSFNGMVKINVNCGSSDFLLFTSPIEVEAGKELKLDVPKLKIAEDQNILGDCSVKLGIEDSAKRAIDEKSSENFKISNNITVTVDTNKEEYEPDKKVTISGRAVLENGQNVDGNASVTLDITMLNNVKAGFFMTDIILDKNAKSGEHEVTVNVEDANHNRGTGKKKITVIAIPSRIDMLLNNESFMPESTLDASIKLYDQAGNEIDTKGTITIYDPDYLEMTSKQINTNENFEYSFPKTAKPGKWEAIIFSSGINAKKFVEIQRLSKISMAIEGSSLIVKNEGNVPYSDTLTFSFEKDGQTQTLTKDVNIEVGGSASIPLRGDGVYNLNVDSGENSVELPAITLTGGALGVGEKININYIAVGVFIVGILALAFVSFRRRLKEKKEGGISTKKMEMKQSEIDKIEEDEE